MVISTRKCRHAHIFNQNTFLKQNILTDNALKKKTQKQQQQQPNKNQLLQF